MAVALVTGGAKRIGRAISLALADPKTEVIIHYNESASDAEKLKTEILDKGIKAHTIGANLANPSECQTLFGRTADLVGKPVDCLINNASLYEPDSVSQLDYSLFKAHQDINLYAPLILSAAFKKQVPQGQTGNIINIIDQRVLNPNGDFISYTLSKASLWTLTKILAKEFAPDIRVNAVGPGPVLKSKHQSNDDFENEKRSVPLKRGATPDEIAQAVLFILKMDAMTGQIIALDGGQHMTT